MAKPHTQNSRNTWMTIILLFIILITLVTFFIYHKKQTYFEPIKIGLITDITDCTNNNKVDLNFFSENTGSEKTNFNISLGDNTNFRTTNCSREYKEKLTKATEKLNSINQTYFMLGDYDIANKNKNLQFWIKQNKNKDYYSFDNGDFHLIVLSVTPERIRSNLSCNDYDYCSELRKNYLELKEIKNNNTLLKEYLEEYNLEKEKFLSLFESKKKAYFDEENRIKNISPKKDDPKIINEMELKWLEDDLKKTDKKKVIILSHEPILSFTESDKKYEGVKNEEKFLEIIKNSKKKVAYISRDSYIWHEEEADDFRYFIIKSHLDKKSYTIFTWDQDDCKIEKHEKN